MVRNAVPAKINLDKLLEGLRTKRFGKRIFFSRVVGSTNELAKELAVLGAPEGTVAIAQTQTAGRGRLSRVWFSPEGGLWFSVVLKPKLKAAEAVRLVFVAGLAVADVLRELYGLKVETKWPNDVLVGGRKICGVLAEMSTLGEKVNFAVLGIGVNANFDVRKVFPEELWESATSLMNELGRKVKLEELFRALLERLDCVYEQFLKEGFNPVLERWKSYAGFLGKQVVVAGETEKLRGLALDVDSEGALVLKLEDGTIRRVFVGDVFF
ncbi:MAG: biotin--[acetyl-CoA-carboxylase] ligase [Candidatus Bathyarchaeia archaeon]